MSVPGWWVTGDGAEDVFDPEPHEQFVLVVRGCEGFDDDHDVGVVPADGPGSEQFSWVSHRSLTITGRSPEGRTGARVGGSWFRGLRWDQGRSSSWGGRGALAAIPGRSSRLRRMSCRPSSCCPTARAYATSRTCVRSGVVAHCPSHRQVRHQRRPWDGNTTVFPSSGITG